MTTRESIRCRKCTATGIHNFVRRTEYLLDGPVLDSIICLICGDRLASKPMADKMNRPVPASEEGHARHLDYPCTVKGCAGFIDPDKSRSGLCFACGKILYSWKFRSGKGIPPLVKVASGYLTRADYLVLNPSAAAPLHPATPCATPGCSATVRRQRAEAGEDLCGNCKQRASRRALRTALKSLEVNHVDAPLSPARYRRYQQKQQQAQHRALLLAVGGTIQRG